MSEINFLIDDTDPRVLYIVCLLCKHLTCVDRDSRLHIEGLCTSCSQRTDIIAEGLGKQ